MSAEFKPDPASVLRAMARNYTDRHCWDHLDVAACLMAADEIDRLRATPAPGAPGQEAAAVQAVGAAEQMLKALKFHPSASHVSPDFRDDFNATLQQHFDNYVRYGAGAGEKTS